MGSARCGQKRQRHRNDKRAKNPEPCGPLTYRLRSEDSHNFYCTPLTHVGFFEPIANPALHPLKVAERPVGNRFDQRFFDGGRQTGVSHQQIEIADPLGPPGVGGAKLGRIDRRLEDYLGYAGAQRGEKLFKLGAIHAAGVHDLVGHENVLFVGQLSGREADFGFVVGAMEPKREPILTTQIDEDIEELGPLLECTAEGSQVGKTETPEHGAFHLSPTLAANLFEVGMIPEIFESAREPALAIEK